MTNKLTSLTGFGEGDPKDENYAVRRSVAKHEFKKMTDNLPGYLKRRGSYRLHLKNHLLKENDPTKWEKYSGAKSKALSKKVSPEVKSFARHYEKTTGEKIRNRHEK